LLAEEATLFHFDSAVDDSKQCILARQGKKKVTTGRKAAEQQDCNSGLPQQVSVPVPCSDVHIGVYMPIPHWLQPLSSMCYYF
jgi:hypothetical protein